MTITETTERDLAAMLPSSVEMTPAVAAALRAPFAPESMGKLPKITCGGCRGSKRNPNPDKVCGRHEKQRCRECRNWITTEHMHLDYVGHAEVTDRLLTIDALWSWEPMAFDSDGLPKIDPMGGLWIRLTVAGVTRPGYGSADGKTGGDAVKELIGDAIRNAAMRFGVALDLWGATFKAAEDDAEADVRQSSPDTPEDDWASASPVRPIGRGDGPVDQQLDEARPPARPVSSTPTRPEYNPAVYPLGVQRIERAKTHAELDQMEANIPVFVASGEITDGEAGRLRLKITNARDILRQPPPGLADQLAQQALETATPTDQEKTR